MKSIINRSFLSVTLVATVLGNYLAYASPVRVVASQQSQSQNADVNISDKSMHDLEISSAKLFVKLEELKLINPELRTNQMQTSNMAQYSAFGGVALIIGGFVVSIGSAKTQNGEFFAEGGTPATVSVGMIAAGSVGLAAGGSLALGGSQIQSLDSQSKAQIRQIVDDYADILSLTAEQKQKLSDSVAEEVARNIKNSNGYFYIDMAQLLLNSSVVDSDTKKLVEVLRSYQQANDPEATKLALQVTKREVLQQRLELLKLVQSNILQAVSDNPEMATKLSSLSSNNKALIAYIESLLN